MSPERPILVIMCVAQGTNANIIGLIPKCQRISVQAVKIAKYVPGHLRSASNSSSISFSLPESDRPIVNMPKCQSRRVFELSYVSGNEFDIFISYTVKI